MFFWNSNSMQTILIVVHLMIVVALVAVVLLQRSEGGALGVGGGSGFMTGRGQANVLTRATAILAALFFVTSLSLTVLAGFGHGQRSILDSSAPATPAAPGQPAALPPKGEGSVLDQLRTIEDQRAKQSGAPTPAVPAAPAPPRGP